MFDSEPIIASERAGENALGLLKRVRDRFDNPQFGLSAISYTELIHGTYRGISNAGRRLNSAAFLQDLIEVVPVYSFNAARAELAGRIDAEQRARGIHIPFADLLIGATALHLNFAILTANERHFRLIPNLRVLTF